MTGLWTNDLDNLADALRHMPYTSPRTIAQTLHDNGVVRVLDPDDTARILYKMFGDFESRSYGVAWDDQLEGYRSVWQARARAYIEALRRP